MIPLAGALSIEDGGGVGLERQIGIITPTQ